METPSCPLPTSAQVVGAVVKLHPISTLGAPLFVLLLLTGLGVYGTLAGAQATANTNREAAHSTADETATSFTLTVQQVRRDAGIHAEPCMCHAGPCGGHAVYCPAWCTAWPCRAEPGGRTATGDTVACTLTVQQRWAGGS